MSKTPAVFLRELRQIQKKRISTSVLVGELGGITMIAGVPVHAWFQADAETVTIYGAEALSELLNSVKVQSLSIARRTEGPVLGSSLAGMQMDRLLDLCDTIFGDLRVGKATLPHEPKKTHPPRLSLERFPVCPTGSDLRLPVTAAAEVKWLALIDAIEPTMITLAGDNEQGVLLIENGHAVDGLWLDSEHEEPLLGSEAVGAITTSKVGNCVAVGIPSVCVWVLPLLWRLPVRWDTIPMRCINPSQYCAFLASLPGDAVCMIESPTDIWVMGIRDGRFHCMWSESNRVPRCDLTELAQVWTAGEGYLTMQRSQESLRDLPVHAGTLALEVAPAELDIEPIAVATLVAEMTNGEVALEAPETEVGEDLAVPEFVAPEPHEIQVAWAKALETLSQIAPEPEEFFSIKSEPEPEPEPLWADVEEPAELEPEVAPETPPVLAENVQVDNADAESALRSWSRVMGVVITQPAWQYLHTHHWNSQLAERLVVDIAQSNGESPIQNWESSLRELMSAYVA